VSPARCETKNAHLVNCHMGNVVLRAPAPSDATPYLTVLQTRTQGNCSINYPLEMKLQADADPQVLFGPFNSTRMITLRRLDRGAITALTAENSSAWEALASYHDDCRVWIEVALNRHDPN
jgi:hypothetical protein